MVGSDDIPCLLSGLLAWALTPHDPLLPPQAVRPQLLVTQQRA